MFGHKKAVLEMPADSTGASGGAMEYAGFWARVVALMVDSAILTIFIIVLFVVLGMVMGASGIALGNIIYFFVYLLYWPVMESSARQATFGKSLMGLQVTDLDGNRTSFIKSLLRNLAKILSSLIMGIGFLLAAFTGRKQALHDMLASCLVVRVSPSSFLKAIVVAVVAFAIAAYGSYYYVTKIYLPQTLGGAMKGAGGDFQREMERAMKDAGKDMARDMERAMKQAELDMKRQREKEAREARKAAPMPPVAKPSAPAPSAPPPSVPVPAAKPAAPGTEKPAVVALAPAKPATGKPAMSSAPAKPADKPTAVEVKPVPAKPATAPTAKAEAAPAAATPAATDRPRVPRRPLAAPPPEAPVVLPMRTPRYNDAMTAVMNRDGAGLAEALDAGMWADRADSNGATALMVAALNGDEAMVQLLLKHGADPNRRGPAGSVLDYANRGGNAQVAGLLKKAGAR